MTEWRRFCLQRIQNFRQCKLTIPTYWKMIFDRIFYCLYFFFFFSFCINSCLLSYRQNLLVYCLTSQNTMFVCISRYNRKISVVFLLQILKALNIFTINDEVKIYKTLLSTLLPHHYILFINWWKYTCIFVYVHRYLCSLITRSILLTIALYKQKMTENL